MSDYPQPVAGSGGVVRSGTGTRRGLQTKPVDSSSSRSHLRLARKVETTRGRLELARCKSLRYQRGSRRRMCQRMLQGLKE